MATLAQQVEQLENENRKLKELLNWQTSRANKYTEFIQQLGLKIETSIEIQDPWDFSNENEIYITREIIRPNPFMIGYVGRKEDLLKEITELTRTRGDV